MSSNVIFAKMCRPPHSSGKHTTERRVMHDVVEWSIVEWRKVEQSVSLSVCLSVCLLVCLLVSLSLSRFRSHFVRLFV